MKEYKIERDSYKCRLLADDGSITPTWIYVDVVTKVNIYRFMSGKTGISRGQPDIEWYIRESLDLEDGTSLRMSYNGRIFTLADIGVTQQTYSSCGSGTTRGIATAFEPE